MAQANLENAKARVEGARAELKAAESEIDRVRALFQEAKDNFQRVSGLFAQGYAAKKDSDAAKAAYDTTNAQRQSALAKKQGIKAELTTVQAGLKAAGAQLNSAKAVIGEAEARLRLIETQARYTEISSPIGGVIAYKSFEAGEMVLAGKTIYTIYDLKNIWGRVDIEETDIGRIKLGGRAMIIIAGLAGRRSEGEVIEIGREAEFATQRDVTRGRQDIKTFRVKVAIKGDEGLLKPGMTVVVRFPAVSP
ncbi:MAG: efflux RND transporter periplasmic adaptor subunit [Nitrospirae bacterium]|nr:efflux RND transporter periplasmic adaptor subunit [Nitrospirota bacterium]